MVIDIFLHLKKLNNKLVTLNVTKQIIFDFWDKFISKVDFANQRI